MITQPDIDNRAVVERLRHLISVLHKTQAEFARLIGIDPSNLSKLLQGRTRVTKRFINRVVHNAGVSREWLLTGSEVPFPRNNDNAAVAHEKTELAMAAPGEAGAPVYDIDVTAGCHELSRLFTDERIIGRLNMPGVDPEYPLVKVSGESMAPRIPDGAFVQIRPISPTSPIFWGSTYVVVTDDYRMVKVLRRHPSPDMVILHSYNPDFDDMELPRTDIISLWLVETVIKYDILT